MPFSWEPRIDSEMESIYWIVRRDMVMALPERTTADIEAILRKLIIDVEAITLEMQQKETRGTHDQ